MCFEHQFTKPKLTDMCDIRSLQYNKCAYSAQRAPSSCLHTGEGSHNDDNNALVGLLASSGLKMQTTDELTSSGMKWPSPSQDMCEELRERWRCSSRGMEPGGGESRSPVPLPPAPRPPTPFLYRLLLSGTGIGGLDSRCNNKCKEYWSTKRSRQQSEIYSCCNKDKHDKFSIVVFTIKRPRFA